jgi:hypothetical protein
MSVSFSRVDRSKTTEVEGRTHPGWINGTCEVNWANANAAVMLGLMGFSGNDLYVGQEGLPEMRRALMLARARVESGRAGQMTREDRIVFGAPRAQDDGTMNLRPIRLMEVGLDLEGIRTRLDLFSAFLDEAAKLGADEIWWG